MKQYKIRYERACKTNEEYIIYMRNKLLAEINIPQKEELTAPLSYGHYVLLFDGEKRAGIGEFYFYKDRYESFQDSIYNDAYDLNLIGDFKEFVHFRSVFLEDEYRNLSNYFLMISANAHYALQFNALYSTSGTSSELKSRERLFLLSGNRLLGNYFVEGKEQKLFLLDLKKYSEGNQYKKSLPLISKGIKE